MYIGFAMPNTPIVMTLTQSIERVIPVGDYRVIMIQSRGAPTYGDGLSVKRSIDGTNPHDFASAVTITSDGITKVDVTDVPHVHISTLTTGSPSGDVELVIWAHDLA